MAELQLRGQHPLRTINHADWYHISIQPCRIKSHCHWILPKSPTMAHRRRTRNTRYDSHRIPRVMSDEWFLISVYPRLRWPAQISRMPEEMRVGDDDGTQRPWELRPRRNSPWFIVLCPLPPIEFTSLWLQIPGRPQHESGRWWTCTSN
jgi:hypothetical protein